MKDALQTKSKDHINIIVVYLSFFFCLDFMFYSLLQRFYFLFIPNLIGVFLWGVNLAIYYWVNGDIHDNSYIIIACFKLLLLLNTLPVLPCQPPSFLLEVT